MTCGRRRAVRRGVQPQRRRQRRPRAYARLRAARRLAEYRRPSARR